jgi:hypothetical protein
MFDLFCLWFGVALRIFRNRQNLLLENLALREQLVVLKRRHPKPKLGLLDKLFWIAARQFWSRWKESLLLDGHFGLQGMRERAARIGGKLTLGSSSNSGAEIKLNSPRRHHLPENARATIFVYRDKKPFSLKGPNLQSGLIAIRRVSPARSIADFFESALAGIRMAAKSRQKPTRSSEYRSLRGRSVHGIRSAPRHNPSRTKKGTFASLF